MYTSHSNSFHSWQSCITTLVSEGGGWSVARVIMDILVIMVVVVIMVVIVIMIIMVITRFVGEVA